MKLHYTTLANQDQPYKGQTHIQTPELIRYLTHVFPAIPPVLTQHITIDFQLSQGAWNKLNSQITEMAETNKLLKRAVKNTYGKVNSIPNPPPKKASNTTKNCHESRQNSKVNLQKDHGRTTKTLTKPLKGKLLKLITKTPHPIH